MLRLADEQDGALVRRRVPLEELDIATDDEVARAVGVLIESRLLTVADGTVEVSHESLLAEWPRLRTWLDEDRAGRRLRAHLAGSAREWEERGREAADLYRGPRLAAALDWSVDHADELNTLEREFLEAARAEHERELAAQRKRNRRLRTMLAGVAALLVLAVIAGVVALVQRRAARRQATVALARQLGAKPFRNLGSIWRCCWRARRSSSTRRPRPTARSSPRCCAARQRSQRSRAHHRPAAGRRREPRRQDARGCREHQLRAVLRHRDASRARGASARLPPRPGAFLGRRQARRPRTREGRAAPMLLDVRNGRSLRQIAWLGIDRRWAYGPTSFAVPILISPDDRRVYLAYSTTDPSDTHDRRTYVDEWSVATRKLLRSVAEPARGMFDANFGPDGDIHLLTDDRLLTIDPGSLEPVASRRVELPETSIPAIAALSPDERTVMLGEPSGGVVFVDTRTGRTTVGAGKTGVGVDAVAFTGNGRAAISAGEDGHVTIWNPKTANVTATFVGHEDRITGMVRTADSRTLYTTSLDGAVFAWDLSGVRAFGHPFVLPVVSAYGQFWVTRATPARPLVRRQLVRDPFRFQEGCGRRGLHPCRHSLVRRSGASRLRGGVARLVAGCDPCSRWARATARSGSGAWERGRAWFAGSSACRSPRSCRRR